MILLLCAMLAADGRSEGRSGGPSSAPASAESNESDETGFDIFSIIEEQEQTVSTGATRTLTVREAPTNVWVVDRATLDRQPMLTVYDALRLVPGVNIIEYTMGQSEANLRFVGSFPEHQSLTLVDGRAAASDALGYFDYSTIDLSLVDKIEVVLGPSSTLYGANAFSGVVNIVTRKPSREGSELRLDVDTGVAAGNSGETRYQPYRTGLLTQGRASYGYGWKTGGIRLAASGLFMGTGGAQGNYKPLIVGDPVRQGSFSVDLAQDAGGVEMRLQISASVKKSPYLFFEMSDAEQQDYAANFLLEKRAIAGPDDRLALNVWVKHNRIAFAASYAGAETIPFVLDTTSMEARLAYTVPTFFKNSLTVGAQARGIFVAPNDEIFLADPGRRQLLAGLFIEDMFRPVQPLILTAGLRLDTREMAATRAFRYLSFSPRVSVVWLVNDDHSLRLEYASAFRTPTAVERALYVEASDGVPIVVGNQDLRNERVHSLTFSYTGRKNWFSARLEVWVERTFDNIIPALTAAQSDVQQVAGQPVYAVDDTSLKYPFYFYNAAGFWIPGASAKFAIEPISQLRLSLVYMFMPSPMTNRAGLIADWQATSRLCFALQFFYYGNANSSFQYPTRLILNAQAAFRLDSQGRWQLALNVLNAIDVRLPARALPNAIQSYRETIAGARSGPRAWLSISYSL